MNNLVQRILHALFFVGFICIVVTGVMAALPKYRQARDLSEQKARLLQRIEEKKQEIADLKARQRRFSSDREFVKSLARQNRRVFPGELVFVFDD